MSPLTNKNKRYTNAFPGPSTGTVGSVPQNSVGGGTQRSGFAAAVDEEGAPPGAETGASGGAGAGAGAGAPHERAVTTKGRRAGGRAKRSTHGGGGDLAATL